MTAVELAELIGALLVVGLILGLVAAIVAE